MSSVTTEKSEVPGVFTQALHFPPTVVQTVLLQRWWNGWQKQSAQDVCKHSWSGLSPTTHYKHRKLSNSNSPKFPTKPVLVLTGYPPTLFVLCIIAGQALKIGKHYAAIVDTPHTFAEAFP